MPASTPLSMPPALFAPTFAPTPMSLDERAAEVIKYTEHVVAIGELFFQNGQTAPHRGAQQYDACIERCAGAIVAHFDAEPRLRARVRFCDTVMGFFYNVAHKAQLRQRRYEEEMQQQQQQRKSRDPRKRPHHQATTTDSTTRQAAHPYHGQRPVRAYKPVPPPPSAIDDLCALLGAASLGPSPADAAPAPLPPPQSQQRAGPGPGPVRSKSSRALDRTGLRVHL